MNSVNHSLGTLSIQVSDSIIKASEPKPSSIEQIAPVQNIKVAQDVILSIPSKLSLTIQLISSDALLKVFAHFNTQERTIIKRVCKQWKSVAQNAYFESAHFKMTHLMSHFKNGMKLLLPALLDCADSYKESLESAPVTLFINSEGQFIKIFSPDSDENWFRPKPIKQELYRFHFLINPKLEKPQSGKNEAFYLNLHAKKHGAFFASPKTPAILKENFTEIFLKEINQLAEQAWKDAKTLDIQKDKFENQPWFLLLTNYKNSQTKLKN